MADDVIPKNADKLLFTHDLIDYVFRDKMEVHVHDVSSDYRDFIYIGFNQTIIDAVEFLEDIFEREINIFYDEFKRTNAINGEQFARLALKQVQKYLPRGFEADNFLKMSVYLAMLAEKFYIDGYTEAPDAAFSFITDSIKDTDMISEGWKLLNKAAELIQTTSLSMPTPSPESDEDQVQFFPPPGHPVVRRVFRPEIDNRIFYERANESGIQALPESSRRDSGNFLNGNCVEKEVPLQKVGKSVFQALAGSSRRDNGNFVNCNFVEKKVTLDKVSKSVFQALPGSSTDNELIENCNSAGKAVLLQNMKPVFQPVPGSIRDSELFENYDLIGKDVLLEIVNKLRFQTLPGSSRDNEHFTNYYFVRKDVLFEIVNKLGFKPLPRGKRDNKCFTNYYFVIKDVLLEAISKLGFQPLSERSRDNKGFTNYFVRKDVLLETINQIVFEPVSGSNRDSELFANYDSSERTFSLQPIRFKWDLHKTDTVQNKSKTNFHVLPCNRTSKVVTRPNFVKKKKSFRSYGFKYNFNETSKIGKGFVSSNKSDGLNAEEISDATICFRSEIGNGHHKSQTERIESHSQVLSGNKLVATYNSVGKKVLQKSKIVGMSSHESPPAKRFVKDAESSISSNELDNFTAKEISDVTFASSTSSHSCREVKSHIETDKQ